MNIPKHQALVTPRDEWAIIKEQATAAVRSGLLPRGMSIEAAAIIALKGREIGIPIMQALGQISVVNGRPVCAAELQLALIYRHCKGAIVNVLESTDIKACIEFIRPGCKPFESTFTIEDAKRAGVASKSVWQQYPKAMLRARAVSAGARVIFPDALMGMSHTPEELGAEVEVDDENTIIVANEPSKTPPQQAVAPPVQQEVLPPDPPGPVDPPATKEKTITEDQARRLYTLATKYGWKHIDVKDYLERVAKVASSFELTQAKYNSVCMYIQSNPRNDRKEPPVEAQDLK